MAKSNHDSPPKDKKKFIPPNNVYPEEGEKNEILLMRKRKRQTSFATVLNISEPHNGVHIYVFTQRPVVSIK